MRCNACQCLNLNSETSCYNCGSTDFHPEECSIEPEQPIDWVPLLIIGLPATLLIAWAICTYIKMRTDGAKLLSQSRTQVPIFAAAPPQDLLSTFKATAFQRVDRIEGLPEPVRQAVHALLQQACLAQEEQLKRNLKAAVELDPHWKALSTREREEFFQHDTPGIANPGAEWCGTDVIREHSLPRRRLIFAATSPKLWIVFYEHGGYAPHNHVVVIGWNDVAGYWVRWISSPRLAKLGICLADLQRIASTGTLHPTEHGED